MMIAAFIGMATKFSEIALGIKYRKKLDDGSYEGGPMYYLRDGVGKRYKWLKWLGYVYAFLVIPTAFIICAVVDTNTISGVVDASFGVKPYITGIVLAVFVSICVFGGTRRVSKICGWLTPIMGAVYLIAGLVIIFSNLSLFPSAIKEIFVSAFNPKSITGGAVGSIFVCMRYGVARGIFSNEAGLGTAAMVHSSADVDSPIKQAFWGPVEVFLDTCFACTVTALAIIMSGIWKSGEYEGAALTMKSFEALLPGNIGAYICLCATVLFGFTCLISYYTHAERSAIFIFGNKSKIVIKILWIVSIVLGSFTTLGLAWSLADTFNGLMAIPNLIALFLLSGTVAKITKESDI